MVKRYWVVTNHQMNDVHNEGQWVPVMDLLVLIVPLLFSTVLNPLWHHRQHLLIIVPKIGPKKEMNEVHVTVHQIVPLEMSVVNPKPYNLEDQEALWGQEPLVVPLAPLGIDPSSIPENSTSTALGSLRSLNPIAADAITQLAALDALLHTHRVCAIPRLYPPISAP